MSSYDAVARGMFERMQAAFMAAGADAVTAMQRAEAAMFGMVQRQATMVAFVVNLPVAGRRLRGDGAAGAADETPALTRAGRSRALSGSMGP